MTGKPNPKIDGAPGGLALPSWLQLPAGSDPARTVLQFSGGKDSLACLYLLEPVWDRITVAWMNAGAPFPETLELMARVRDMVPHFLEVQADVLADIDRSGWPVDVLPVERTAFGASLTEEPGPVLRAWIDCCAANVWIPFHRQMLGMGARTIIRGQRGDDRVRGHRRDGDADENGLRYWMPLEGWSEGDVFAYLKGRGVNLPRYYDFMTVTPDCRCCTAQVRTHRGRLAYMKQHAPEDHAALSSLLTTIRGAVAGAVEDEARALRDELAGLARPGTPRA